MPQPTTHHNKVVSAYIALGGNVTSLYGPPKLTLLDALRRIETDSVVMGERSDLYATPAFPAGSGPDFVNAVVSVRTTLSPEALLAHLHDVERQLGRDRKKRWAARTIDLDLIAYGDAIHPSLDAYMGWHDLPLEEQQRVAPDGLILPHPRIQDRSFVLGPLCDVAPDWMHPVLNQTARALFDALPQVERRSLKPLTNGT